MCDGNSLGVLSETSLLYDLHFNSITLATMCGLQELHAEWVPASSPGGKPSKPHREGGCPPRPKVTKER